MNYQQPDPIVVEFFVKFSRFEYALKRAGYLDTTRNRVEVDWNKFAENIGQGFQDRLSHPEYAQLNSAVEFLQNQPPKKLVLQSGTDDLCWKKSDPSQGDVVKNILVLLRRIRNNLFHGEKPRTIVGGSQRGKKLIKHGLTIIETCLELDQQVSQLASSFYRTHSCPDQD